jgi:hypothetical protein
MFKSLHQKILQILRRLPGDHCRGDDICRRSSSHTRRGVASAPRSAVADTRTPRGRGALPYDRTTGIIPAYKVASAVVLRGLGDKPRAEGMGACMELRVDAWRRLGGSMNGLGQGRRSLPQTTPISSCGSCAWASPWRRLRPRRSNTTDIAIGLPPANS